MAAEGESAESQGKILGGGRESLHLDCVYILAETRGLRVRECCVSCGLGLAWLSLVSLGYSRQMCWSLTGDLWSCHLMWIALPHSVPESCHPGLPLVLPSPSHLFLCLWLNWLAVNSSVLLDLQWHWQVTVGVWVGSLSQAEPDHDHVHDPYPGAGHQFINRINLAKSVCQCWHWSAGTLWPSQTCVRGCQLSLGPGLAPGQGQSHQDDTTLLCYNLRLSTLRHRLVLAYS